MQEILDSYADYLTDLKLSVDSKLDFALRASEKAVEIRNSNTYNPVLESKLSELLVARIKGWEFLLRP
jgi:hypothetical protein